MIWFKGWDNKYSQVREKVDATFEAEEVVMFSLGTLTFTKAVLRTLRSQGRKGRILDMDLTGAAMKKAYPKRVALLARKRTLL